MTVALIILGLFLLAALYVGWEYRHAIDWDDSHLTDDESRFDYLATPVFEAVVADLGYRPSERAS